MRTTTDKYGGYVYNFDTSILDFGGHLAQSKALKIGEISSYGRSLAFKVGDKNIFALSATAIKTEATQKEESQSPPYDFNNDNRVNLIDYSILAFWYKKTSAPANVDLNHDGKINIIDFSIMAYNWTR